MRSVTAIEMANELPDGGRADEAKPPNTPRRYKYIEIAHRDSGWIWRFIASNGKELGRSSESYRRRSDCDWSLHLMFGGFAMINPKVSILRDGTVWHRPGSNWWVHIRVVDERTPRTPK